MNEIDLRILKINIYIKLVVYIIILVILICILAFNNWFTIELSNQFNEEEFINIIEENILSNLMQTFNEMIKKINIKTEGIQTLLDTLLLKNPFLESKINEAKELLYFIRDNAIKTIENNFIEFSECIRTYFKDEYFRFKIKIKVGLFDLLLKEYIHTKNNKLDLNSKGVYDVDSFSNVINKFLHKNSHFIKDTIFLYLHNLTGLKPDYLKTDQTSCFDKIISNKENLKLKETADKFVDLINEFNIDFSDFFDKKEIEDKVEFIMKEVTDFKNETMNLINKNLDTFDEKLKEAIYVNIKPEDVKIIILIKKIIYGVLLFKIGLIFLYIIYLIYCIFNFNSISYSILVNVMIILRYALVILLLLILALNYVFTDVSKPILLLRLLVKKFNLNLNIKYGISFKLALFIFMFLLIIFTFPLNLILRKILVYKN
jgi:hypothetical protein